MNAATSLPTDVGVGFKPEHARDVIEGERGVAFFEVHAENYMGAGGPPHAILERLRASYPLSLHGVGLSIGGARPLDRRHLARLRRLIARYQPNAFSEHLAWSTHDGVFFNDLLPVPYNGETLARVCEHIDEVQTALRTRMLLENPSTYVVFDTSTMGEVEFLREVIRRTGCGLLLDVNNVYVSAVNHAFDPIAYLDAFPSEHVGEIHLAGFAEDRDEAGARLRPKHRRKLVLIAYQDDAADRARLVISSARKMSAKCGKSTIDISSTIRLSVISYAVMSPVS